MSGWSAERLTLTYRGASAAALDSVSMAVPASSCTAVLGPNGSGKSTLLRILLGVLAPDSGSACFAGRDLREWPRAELARRVGAVPQGEENAFPITVREMVELGRYPHLGPWRRARASDVQAVEEAMHRCDVARLADRTVDRLSGCGTVSRRAVRRGDRWRRRRSHRGSPGGNGRSRPQRADGCRRRFRPARPGCRHV